MAREFVELLLSQEARLKHRYGLTWTIVGIATADHGSAIDSDGIDPRQAIAAFDHGSLTELHSPHAGRPATDTVSLVERAATLSHAPEPTARVVVVENTSLGLLRRVFSERAADRKECGLRFPGRRCGRDQNVAPVQDWRDRPLLDIA